jgi:hypothetical protein
MIAEWGGIRPNIGNAKSVGSLEPSQEIDPLPISGYERHRDEIKTEYEKPRDEAQLKESDYEKTV